MAPKIVYEIDGRRVVVPLDKDEVLIGRGPANDVVINRQYVSRRHARLHRDGDSWRVVDLGSKCGTSVNDLAHTDKVLVHGDTIYLQDFPLRFVEKLPIRSSPAVGDARRDPFAASVSLTGAGDLESAAGVQTVYQSAVDFSELASISADVSRLQRLLALVTRSSQTILATASLDEMFGKVLELVFEHLPVQRGFIMLWDDEREDLVPKCAKQQGVGGSSDAGIQFSRTIAEKVCREKVAVLSMDAQTDGRFEGGESIIQLGIRSAMAAPIWNGDRVEGLIYADTLHRAEAFDKFDLDLLSALGNHLAITIERSRLQDSVLEQRLVRRRLERYHSPAVVERIVAHSGSAAETLLADERDVTVLFADVVGFTRRCERMEPRSVAELLNRYFSEMTEAVFRHDGTLDKYIGDCLMAVFGAPLTAEDHARQAVEAALDMRETLVRLNEPLPEKARVQFRVGIHSGRVVAGDIGSVRRRDYTVLGSTVNLAARLESLVARPGQIVISDATRTAAEGCYETRLVGEHVLKGLSESVRCYELVGRAADDAVGSDAGA